jgi:Leucine-rich repeat (LRR) protein
MHIPNTSPYVRILECDVQLIAAKKKLSKIDALEYLLQLLTPCTSALYLTGINVPRIPSLKHLTNLTHLDLSWNELRELPEMPEGLDWLMCSRNRLTSLQGIPSTVRTLIGDSNKVRVVSGLPAGLIKMCLADNRIEHIESFPPTLQLCYVSYNNLQEFPPFPDTIEVLSVMSNNLRELPPRLPASLQTLLCDGNPRLSVLPEMPGNLVRLSVQQCNISRFPRLPDTLSVLDIRDTPVLHMENIPEYLFDPYHMMDNTPIGQWIEPRVSDEALRNLSSFDVLGLYRDNLQKLHRFREMYFALRFKRQFWRWMWNKHRIARIERAHHPDRLKERLEQDGGEEADLEDVLQKLGNS